MAEETLDGRELSEAMDDDIRATLRDIQSRNTEAEPAAPEKVAAETVTPEPEKPEGERPRAPDGKFVKTESAAPAKADTPAKEPAAPEQVTAELTDPTKYVAKSGKVLDLTRPPASWKPGAKAQWNALPMETRQEVYRREDEIHENFGGMRETANFGKAVQDVVAPYLPLIQAEGGTPERAIGDLLKTAQLFRTAPQATKLQALFQLDQQFGVGLQAYIQQEVLRHSGQAGVTVPQPQVSADPRYDALQQQFQQISTALQQQERERATQAERVSNAAVENFIASKGTDGQPLYPFVDNVLDDMSMRVQALRRSNPALEHAEALKVAYEQAVWANPETRAVLLAKQQAQVNQPAVSQQRVESARRASAGNMPKRGAIPATAPVGNLRLGTPESDESIRETFRQLQANT